MPRNFGRGKMGAIMSDRERLIEILKTPIFPHEEVDPIEAVADYLIDSGVVVQKHGRWIPVSKPPEKFESVLVYYPQKDYGVKYVIDYNEAESDEAPYFTEQRRFGKPTHWMPLPELPKEGEA